MDELSNVLASKNSQKQRVTYGMIPCAGDIQNRLSVRQSRGEVAKGCKGELLGEE